MKLSELQFSDLYLGVQFADIKGLMNAGKSRVRAPEQLQAELAVLRQECGAVYARDGEPEFMVCHDNVSFRVTVVQDMKEGQIYILRPSWFVLRPFDRLPLPAHIKDVLLDPALRGLVLIAGEIASGKTSTAVSLLVERLKRNGGVCVTVEDPPEYTLAGEHGDGRCIQVRATRKTGGYAEQLKLAMRSGADLIFLGEIRDDATAAEAVNASVNGHLVITTMHGGSPVQAIERLATFARVINPSANELLSEGLSVVIHQKMEVDMRADQTIRRMRLTTLDLTSSNAARAKLRDGAISQLAHEITEQANRTTWK